MWVSYCDSMWRSVCRTAVTCRCVSSRWRVDRWAGDNQIVLSTTDWNWGGDKDVLTRRHSERSCTFLGYSAPSRHPSVPNGRAKYQVVLKSCTLGIRHTTGHAVVLMSFITCAWNYRLKQHRIAKIDMLENFGELVFKGLFHINHNMSSVECSDWV